MSNGGIDRRDFLKGAAATAALLFTAKDVFATEEGEAAEIAGPAVKIGVIGLGKWGSQLTSTLSRVPSAQVTAICDTYEAYLKRASRFAPDAEQFTDYRKLLESPNVEAVVVATPSHQHRQIALAAVDAGKHVYCEAPLAVDVVEARDIALAGRGSKQVFQVGQQARSNRLYQHVEDFVRCGALGKTAQVYGQWYKKESWRRMAPTPERENELNWRLSSETSAGLVGEVGIHQIDLANWYLNSLPKAVTGFGSTINWNDGRDVPDTVQCVLEYPNNVRMIYASSLASSFSGEYTLFQGSDSTLALRENEGWMVKEADSPLLGWEVYARKEECFGETGICMVADATKILSESAEHDADDAEPTKTAVYSALENFTRSIREGADVACGAVEGFQAAVTAIKANQAIVSGIKVNYEDDWFDLG